ncbi:CHASE domain-containing protein [Pseudaminobacter soli (ex Li et al. 2025)]|uniref:histidine kinase n=1 Tax=Pseudaminobacter soli (ex Li et al. 2025) TaxID=1295366 RepID=A0A2P7SA27_9HYPH|nr:CHASE domain-containing protein [Mesorhizobium soli]PSJ59344.1 histidine kinase [Mesorhizobium soli]
MKKFFSVAAFLAVALASLGLASFAYVASQEAARFKFEATVDDAMNRIEGRLDLQLSLLRSTQALFQARDGSMSRAEFSAFYDALDVKDNFKGLRGIGYLGFGTTGEEAELENRIQHIHGVDRAVHPPSTQDWRTPVLLYEPMDDSDLTGIGFDMFTDPARRSAIEMAVHSGQPRATGRILLGEESPEIQRVPGFLVFASVTDNSPKANTDPKPDVVGLVFVAFRTGDLFQAALGAAPALPVSAEVFDGAASDEHLFYRSPVTPSSAYGDDFRVTRTIILAGRPWTLRFRPTVGFSEPSSPTIPVLLGLFGLLLAGAVALVARYQERAYEAVSQLHETTEKSLLEKDLMLQEMKHRIKNSITRVLAMARQTAAHAPDLNEFSKSFAARLQAMAASQDMLTRSRWQKADLRELLEIELGQVFGKELPEDMLTGPMVLLDETMTQALGLTFHELATNALKYGEVSESMGALKVSWTVTGQGKDRRLALTWKESSSKPIEPPTRIGFGTKLIDMNIQRELYGTINREYGSDGLVVLIEVPLTPPNKKQAA